MAQATPFRNPSGATVWRVQFRIDGKGKQKTFTHADDAERFADLVTRHGGEAALRRWASKAGTAASRKPTLRAWVETYLDPASGVLTGIEPGTRDGYKRIADNSFLLHLGELGIDEITKDDVGAWVAWQEQQPSKRQPNKLIAAKTMRNYHALLSNVFEAAKDRKLIETNPAHRTKVSKGVAREAVFLTTDEFWRLHDAIPDHFKGFVYFLAGTGARWSEATALTWGDIHASTTPPTVRISRAFKKNPGGAPLPKTPKSRAGRRTIAITPPILASLGDPGTRDALVFTGTSGVGRIWYGGFRDRVWIPSVKRAGLEDRGPTPHDLRHTHASWLIADGNPLPFIQQRLGHENITTTISVYGHLLPDAHVRMASSIDGILARKAVEA